MVYGWLISFYQTKVVHSELQPYIVCRHINSKQASGSKINAIYSTPSCYLKAVNDQKITFPTKQDDFFPYKSDRHSYWTGYFTSRPTQKYYERRGNNYLQVRTPIIEIHVYTYHILNSLGIHVLYALSLLLFKSWLDKPKYLTY